MQEVYWTETCSIKDAVEWMEELLENALATIDNFQIVEQYDCFYCVVVGLPQHKTEYSMYKEIAHVNS